MQRNTTTAMLQKKLEGDNKDALLKHTKPCLDDNGNFTPELVTALLKSMHSSHADVKGGVISTFNATHASNNLICPVTGAKFQSDPETGYAKFLHLGTLRFWNANGWVDEKRWAEFVEFTTKDQSDKKDKIVTYGNFKAFYDLCVKNDDPEKNTGRHAMGLFPSVSVAVQHQAGIQAWNEIFDRFTCGWEPEQYIKLDVLRLFVDDSGKAYDMVKRGELPVPKPELMSVNPFYSP